MEEYSDKELLETARDHFREGNYRIAEPILQQLVASGVIEQKADGFVFRQDYAFGSPSGAAQIVGGC